MCTGLGQNRGGERTRKGPSRRIQSKAQKRHGERSLRGNKCILHFPLAFVQGAVLRPVATGFFTDPVFPRERYKPEARGSEAQTEKLSMGRYEAQDRVMPLWRNPSHTPERKLTC